MRSIRDMQIPWRTIQVCINIGTIVFGFCTFMPLGYLNNYFLQRCVLYADVRVQSANATASIVDIQNSIFGESSKCTYTTYASVLAAIHAFIWCWFYLLMKSHLKSEHREFSLLLPSFLLHTIMLVVVFVSSSILSAGVEMFCHNLVRELVPFTTSIGKTLTCEESQDLQWSIFEKKHKFYTFLLVAKVSSWIMTVTVLCQSVLCAYELYAWFLHETDAFSKERTKRRGSKDSKLSHVNSVFKDIGTDSDIQSVHSSDSTASIGFSGVEEPKRERQPFV